MFTKYCMGEGTKSSCLGKSCHPIDPIRSNPIEHEEEEEEEEKEKRYSFYVQVIFRIHSESRTRDGDLEYVYPQARAFTLSGRKCLCMYRSPKAVGSGVEGERWGREGKAKRHHQLPVWLSGCPAPSHLIHPTPPGANKIDSLVPSIPPSFHLLQTRS